MVFFAKILPAVTAQFKYSYYLSDPFIQMTKNEIRKYRYFWNNFYVGSQQSQQICRVSILSS